MTYVAHSVGEGVSETLQSFESCSGNFGIKLLFLDVHVHVCCNLIIIA